METGGETREKREEAERGEEMRRRGKTEPADLCELPTKSKR